MLSGQSFINFEILAEETDTIIFEITNFVCGIFLPIILRMADNFETVYF